MNKELKLKARAMLNSPEELTIITHKNCNDGNSVVMAFAKLLNVTIADLDVIYLHYGDNLSKIKARVKNRNVFMGDFSLPINDMNDIAIASNSFVCVDHHETAANNLKDLDFAHFQMGVSGGVLTWEILSDDKVPSLIAYIGDRDVWDWKLPSSEAINAVAGLYKDDIEKLYTFIDKTEEMVKEGELLLLKDQQTIKGIMKRIPYSKFIELDNHRVPLLNTTTLISEIGNAISKEYDFAVMYFFTDKKIVFSLRSDKDKPNFTNVSKIASSFGGGGHAPAAGFSFNLEEFDFDAFYIHGIIRTKGGIFTKLLRFLSFNK